LLAAAVSASGADAVISGLARGDRVGHAHVLDGAGRTVRGAVHLAGITVRPV